MSRFTEQNISFSGTDAVIIANVPMPDGEIFTETLGALQTLSYSTHIDKKPVRSLGNINAKGYVHGSRTIAGSMVFAVFNRHFSEQIIEKMREKTDANSALFLADELPPFDLTLVYANEYGKTSRMALYNVTFISEGQVVSVNDVFTENTYQFLATDLEYLNPEERRLSSYTRQEATEPRSEWTNRPPLSYNRWTPASADYSNFVRTQHREGYLYFDAYYSVESSTAFELRSVRDDAVYTHSSLTLEEGGRREKSFKVKAPLGQYRVYSRPSNRLLGQF